MASSFSALGTVGGPDYTARTASQAAVAAEYAAEASAKGRRIRCNRGGGWMSTAECVVQYRAGQDDPDSQPNCSRDLGCSAGRMRARNFKEDDMGKKGRTNYGACIACGRMGNRNSAGECYRAECKVARTMAGEKQESPIEAPEETCGLGADLAASGQDEAAAAVEEIGVEGVAAGQDHVEEPRHMVEAEPDHAGGANEMVPDLDDSTEPFVLAGIEFAPIKKQRPLGENRVTIRKLSIGISDRADKLFDLARYTHARYTVSLDGKSLAIKFLGGPKGDAVKIGRSTGGVSISSVPLGREHPHLIGKRAPLEATGMSGWYVVRLSGEAA